MDLAASEFAESDLGDMMFFTQRAQMAVDAKNFGPQALGARALPADKIGKLRAARFRLLAALVDGARGAKPKAAARAQAMFDCWMQEQEENFQPADIARCRAAFEKAMAALRIVPVVAKAAPPPPMPKPMPAPAKMPGPFTVYFDFDKSNINAAAQKSITDIAAAHKQAKPSALLLGGHTDRAGDGSYNNTLSRMRAQSVAAALIKFGVPVPKIKVDSFGETLTQVSTPDNKRERMNRRVVVNFRR